MAKMEEEGLNCDKTCFGDDQPTAVAAKKKMFVAKNKKWTPVMSVPVM